MASPASPPLEPIAASGGANGAALPEPVDRSETTTNEDEDEEVEFLSKSLWLFTPEHPVRAFLIRLITNPWFDRFILLVILVTAVFLALQNPTAPSNSGFNRVSTIADYVHGLEVFIARQDD